MTSNSNDTKIRLYMKFQQIACDRDFHMIELWLPHK